MESIAALIVTVEPESRWQSGCWRQEKFAVLSRKMQSEKACCVIETSPIPAALEKASLIGQKSHLQIRPT
jgi:hypothetical protein